MAEMILKNHNNADLFKLSKEDPHRLPNVIEFVTEQIGNDSQIINEYFKNYSERKKRLKESNLTLEKLEIMEKNINAPGQDKELTIYQPLIVPDENKVRKLLSNSGWKREFAQ